MKCATCLGTDMNCPEQDCANGMDRCFSATFKAKNGGANVKYGQCTNKDTCKSLEDAAKLLADGDIKVRVLGWKNQLLGLFIRRYF